MSEYFKDIPEYHIEKILELIEELIEFYHDDDWLVVKKYLLRHTHPKIRKNTPRFPGRCLIFETMFGITL